MKVIPPKSPAYRFELGSRYAAKGFLGGALLGAAISLPAFLFIESYWCFLVTPIAGAIGYFTRRIIRIHSRL